MGCELKNENIVYSMLKAIGDKIQMERMLNLIKQKDFFNEFLGGFRNLLNSEEKSQIEDAYPEISTF